MKRHARTHYLEDAIRTLVCCTNAITRAGKIQYIDVGQKISAIHVDLFFIVVE